MVKYFVTEEPYRKATGFPKNPVALEEYRLYINRVFRDPVSRTVMCCADTDDDTQDIMGISCIAEEKETNWNMTAGMETEEAKKYNEICADDELGFDLMKKFNIPSHYADKSLLVLPKYRGHCISQQF
ncbi:uncharacterized protein LOC125228463 [Leguminivora glycinivorella]|uniref:uncharacterized protein LOC125228463 n=1 Tax=Leguminivora glycinivorella TaxID=1035111 RepID=UPI00200C0B9A|nr:uncharacterized protein LOC125228463 [Leguminivora glycinivorella]